MLKIKKVIFDENGNVSMQLKHRNYDIKISSKPNYAYRTDILSGHGELVSYLTHSYYYSRKKEFKSKCYKLADYGINFLTYKYFIRYFYTTNELVLEILNNKHYCYDVYVNISLFSVGLISLNSLSGDMDFDIVDTVNFKKHELVELINEVIKEADKDAKHAEHNIFNHRPNSADRIRL